MWELYVFMLLAPTLVWAQQPPPRFQDYPVAKRYTRHRVAPKLYPGTDAWYFRTRIREAAKGKPNFAGHYILAQWGCGAECLTSVIIDAQTGAVHLTGFTNCCWHSTATIEVKAADADPADVKEPIAFRLNSRLVIFTGLLNEAGRDEPHYFKFERSKLVALP